MEERKVIYNVTVKIEKQAESDWIQWMRDSHIPDVLATKCFMNAKLNKILFLDESDGITYTVQYLCKDMKTLDHYHKEFASKLQKDLVSNFKDKYVAFRSIMEVHGEFSL